MLNGGVSNNLVKVSLFPFNTTEDFDSCIINNVSEIIIQRVKRYIIRDFEVMEASVEDFGVSEITIFLEEMLVGVFRKFDAGFVENG